VVWSSTSRFQQFATVHVASNDTAQAGSDPACGESLDLDAYIYLLATPCGREGSAYLARVGRTGDNPLRASEYRYFGGRRINGSVVWVADEATATSVLPSGVGELSVSWSAVLGRFVASYTAPYSRVVARVSRCLWSDWGPERLLAAQGGASGPDELVCVAELSFPPSAHAFYLPSRAATHSVIVGLLLYHRSHV
jgi:hypothetical protein